MIQDSGIFGYARTGTISEGVEFPIVVDITNSNLLKYDMNKISILGNEFAREILYPDALAIEGAPYFLEGDTIALFYNAIELMQRPESFLEKLFRIRKKVGFKKLIYAQSVADPYLIPILIYAGVQIFDDSYIRMESANRTKYTMFGKIEVDYNPIDENLEFIRDEISLLKQSILNGTLREIVEKFSISSKAVELLRLLDNNYYNEIEEVFPSRTQYIKANTIEALKRPDLLRYQENLIERYSRPENTEIALILPCSARKPYSSSKSHKAILSQIEQYRKYLHELIVTSPVGLVPRELEEGYPSRFYDIPVIGLWYEEEKTMMNDLLTKYLHNNHYSKIIAYITEDLEFIGKALPREAVIISGDLRDKTNLRRLKAAIEDSLKESATEKKSRTERKLQDYKAIAGFQFGNWIVGKLEGTKIHTSYNQDMLVRDGAILLVYNKNLGKFTINKNSAEFFLERRDHIIEIDDFKPTANVYAVGIVNATPDIRPEDEVVLVHGGEIRGVGIAKMPFQAMIDLDKGIAVKVRG